MTVPVPRPPDGARLVDLAARRRWLGNPRVVYALPREGWLLLPDAGEAIAWGAAGLRVGEGEDCRPLPVEAAVDEALRAWWPALWRGEEVWTAARDAARGIASESVSAAARESALALPPPPPPPASADSGTPILGLLHWRGLLGRMPAAAARDLLTYLHRD